MPDLLIPGIIHQPVSPFIEFIIELIQIHV